MTHGPIASINTDQEDNNQTQKVSCLEVLAALGDDIAGTGPNISTILGLKKMTPSQILRNMNWLTQNLNGKRFLDNKQQLEVVFKLQMFVGPSWNQKWARIDHLTDIEDTRNIGHGQDHQMKRSGYQVN